jgi:hypothetical protein
VADLAVRAGTSPSTVARLEKGDPGVAIGTLADVLVVLGLCNGWPTSLTSARTIWG